MNTLYKNPFRRIEANEKTPPQQKKDMVITDIRLLSKTGGVHGDYRREE